jgi:hypothetical protein
MPPKQETKPLARWSSKCAAARALKRGLADGTIDNNTKPKDVYESDPLFMKYSLSTFRSALNRARAEDGCLVRDDGKFYLLVDTLNEYADTGD